MPTVPFALQCLFPENRLLPLKDSTDGTRAMSSHRISNIPEFDYYLQIYPNGNNTDGGPAQTSIFLQLKLKTVKKVEADFTVTIESANASYKSLFFCVYYIYDKSTGWGFRVCSTDDFFNAEKKFIVDGKCAVKVSGMFKYETDNAPDLINEQKWIGSEMGDDFWQKEDTKDFSILVDGHQIEVHKFILANRSEAFTAMLSANMIEAAQNKLVIVDFAVNVVVAALQIIYSCNFSTFLSIDELLALVQFFDKYNLTAFKTKVEPFLVDQITAATVCHLTNGSILTNAFHLKQECMKFLSTAFISKTRLHDFMTLDKDIVMEIIQSASYQNVQLKD